MQILFYSLSFLDFIDPSCNLTWLQCTGISTAEFWVNSVIYWVGLPSATSALISLMDWICSWALKSPGTEQPTSTVANFCQLGDLQGHCLLGKVPWTLQLSNLAQNCLEERCRGPSSELISLDKPIPVARNVPMHRFIYWWKALKLHHSWSENDSLQGFQGIQVPCRVKMAFG